MDLTTKLTAGNRSGFGEIWKVTAQFRRIMKITAALMFVAAMQVSARGLGQRVTLSVKDAPLKTVFIALNQQTGYNFLYSDEVLSKADKVTINVTDAPLSEVLQLCFANQPLSYTVQDNSIVIKAKEDLKLNDQAISPTPPINVHGKVLNEKGDPIEGVTVTVKGTNVSTLTDANGEFSLSNVNRNATLVFTHVSMETYQMKINGKTDLVIQMKVRTTSLNGIKVYSTGYENISPERAVGSFAHPNEYMYDNRVSTDVISKLEGITSGLVFNPPGITNANGNSLSIRGRSTIFANDQPLIVVDNFPYDGDINNINPNDVASVTVLKDAAAAAIWGVRAGNGVIVITTKKGSYNQPMQVSLDASLTVSSKPNLFYDPNFLDANDFINVEQYLFSQGFYDGNIGDPNSPLSPVVNILAAQRAGTITQDQANQQINALRNYDVRNDESKYFYRKAFEQQYNVHVSGGSSKDAYYFSFGYDRNLLNQVGNSYQRYTINSFNTFKPIRNLEITTGVNYVQNPTTVDNTLQELPTGGISTDYNTIYPYAQLADAKGSPLAVTKSYSSDYVASASGYGFQNWQFVPLQELRNGWNTTKANNNDIRLNLGIKYTILPGLDAAVKYQYEKGLTTSNEVFDQNSFFARNMVNRFAIVDGSGNVTGYNVPVGNIRYANTGDLSSNQFRGQLDYNKAWGRNYLSVLGGVEIRSTNASSDNYSLYGYDPSSGGVAQAIDYTGYFSTNPLGTLASIPGSPNTGSTADRFRSFFGNASYTYDYRYTLYVSGRIDGSNYFGVNTNQKNVPLWSAGGKWDVSKENFYHIGWLPNLSLRASYGFNGNLDKNLAAITTIFYSGTPASYTNAPYAVINNLGNPDLQWEKIGMANFGLDFSTQRQVISGSIEYFHKSGKDMLGEAAFAPSTGVTQFFGNYAGISGHGIDVQLNTTNIRGRFRWTSSFLFSWATDKVTSYSMQTTANQLLGADKGIFPIVGKPVYGLYGLKWGGLDANGNPQGYDTTGKLSENYGILTRPSGTDQLLYKGPARPAFYGGLENSFFYRGITIAFNISYKLDYYFRRSSINYSQLFNYWQGNRDFTKRWQKSGDESHTNVPSMIYPTDQTRDLFYNKSDVLIDKGDQIRLQDISLSYSLDRTTIKRLPFPRIQLFVYANNIGILWRANKDGLDPDYPVGGIPAERTYSFGIKTEF